MRTDFFNRKFTIGDVVLFVYAVSNLGGYSRPTYQMGKIINITLKTCEIKCRNPYNKGTFEVRKHHNKLIILPNDIKLSYALGKKIVNEEWT